MYRIRKLSVQMLKDKMNDSHLFENDTGAKRDIMSILVRARKVELDGGKGDYAMSDRAMMDQVVRRRCESPRIHFKFLVAHLSWRWA